MVPWERSLVPGERPLRQGGVTAGHSAGCERLHWAAGHAAEEDTGRGEGGAGEPSGPPTEPVHQDHADPVVHIVSIHVLETSIYSYA